MTLVLSGNGKSGRRVAARLTDRGMPVRIGSRSGSPPFDWDDSSTWAPALAGVDRAYVAYVPDLGFPGAAETIGAFAKTAVAAGVSRFVLLSGRGEEAAQRSEEAVRAAGGDWTVIRASWFNQNFSEDFLLESVRSGVLALPGPATRREPFADVDDVADVAVAALTEDGHAGQTYEVTNRSSRTLAETVTLLGKAIGRDVRYVEVTPEEYRSALIEHGAPEDFAANLTRLFAGILDGRNEDVTDGVQRALGRSPRDFPEYLSATAATGVWASPA
ncbi:MAG: NmrA family NAD(P)-binding protein [Actinoplanes sp.]